MRVFIFGENPNDTRALKALILGLRPDLNGSDVRTLREPPTLQRGSHDRPVSSWAEKARRAITAAGGGEQNVFAVLAHSDADGPDNGAFADSRTRQLRNAGLPTAHAIVPVEAIESWWLRHPAETESVVPSWRGALRRDSYNTDGVKDPKGDLVRRTRAKAHRRPYQEADSVAIAAAIGNRGASSAPRAASPSYERFCTLVSNL